MLFVNNAFTKVKTRFYKYRFLFVKEKCNFIYFNALKMFYPSIYYFFVTHHAKINYLRTLKQVENV